MKFKKKLNSFSSTEQPLITALTQLLTSSFFQLDHRHRATNRNEQKRLTQKLTLYSAHRKLRSHILLTLILFQKGYQGFIVLQKMANIVSKFSTLKIQIIIIMQQPPPPSQGTASQPRQGQSIFFNKMGHFCQYLHLILG